MEDFFSKEFNSAQEFIYYFNHPVINKSSNLKIEQKFSCCGSVQVDEINSMEVCVKCGKGKDRMILTTWENDEKYKKKHTFTSKETTYTNYLNRRFCLKTNLPHEIVTEFKSKVFISIEELYKYLKDRKLYRYLNQIDYIWYIVSGYKIEITHSEKLAIIKDFKMIYSTFLRLVQAGIIKDRTSIWLYEFLLLKSCEHLEYNHIVKEIMKKEVLKNPKNIKLYNRQWKILCDETGREFIPYKLKRVYQPKREKS